MLTDLLSRSRIRALGGSRSLEAGQDYAAAGAVRVTNLDDHQVSATVQGTRRYTVALAEESGELIYECSCPMGEQGQFCKHCVAVAVEVGGWSGRRSKASKPAVTTEEVREHLMAYRKQALVDLVLEQAEEDDRLRDRLLMAVAGGLPGGPDLETFKTALRDAIEPDAFVPYRESYDWFRGVEAAIAGAEELLAQGHAEAVIDVCESGLEALDGVGGSIDDSDGNVGAVARRLGDLHLLACRRASVDVTELGCRLMKLEMTSEHEAFYDGLDRYASVLGKPGIDAYRRAAEGHWAKVPALAPGEDDAAGFHDRYRITRIMEALARRSGKPDELVGVLSRDLSRPDRFLEIAKVYGDAGQHDEALDWARRGIASFAGRPDWQLQEFAAGELHRRGDHDEAMQLAWAQFEASAGLTTYERLFQHATEARADWTEWSNRALRFLRQEIDRQTEARDRERYRWEPRPDHSRLVEIFLWRKEPEFAWEEAQKGGCNAPLWMRLAELREGAHPGDAIPIYQQAVERLIGQKHNQAYGEAVDLMKRIASVMARLSPPEDFGVYVSEVRARHRPKRNLMALLQRAGW